MYYKVTDLRNDPNYIRYYINWTRFLATGLGPMAALVFFNYSIFRGIRSACRRMILLVVFQVGWADIDFDHFTACLVPLLADGMIDWAWYQGTKWNF